MLTCQQDVEQLSDGLRFVDRGLDVEDIVVLRELLGFASLNCTPTAVTLVPHKPHLHERLGPLADCTEPLFYMLERSAVGDIEYDKGADCPTILAELSQGYLMVTARNCSCPAVSQI